MLAGQEGKGKQRVKKINKILAGDGRVRKAERLGRKGEKTH